MKRSHPFQSQTARICVLNRFYLEIFENAILIIKVIISSTTKHQRMLLISQYVAFDVRFVLCNI